MKTLDNKISHYMHIDNGGVTISITKQENDDGVPLNSLVELVSSSYGNSANITFSINKDNAIEAAEFTANNKF